MPSRWAIILTPGWKASPPPPKPARTEFQIPEDAVTLSERYYQLGPLVTSQSVDFLANIDSPTVLVAHQKLERYSEESLYKSVCPVCRIGILLVGRDLESARILPVDRCTRCAQRVYYTDYKDIPGSRLP